MSIEPSARECDATPVDGLLADPMYGGNNNKVGWKMIGFPGAYADYHNLIHKAWRSLARWNWKPLRLEGSD